MEKFVEHLKFHVALVGDCSQTPAGAVMESEDMLHQCRKKSLQTTIG